MSNNNFYKYNLLTKKAFEFQSKIMSGKTMEFTKAEVGDGTISGVEEAENIQALKNKICDIKIISLVANGHTVELTVLLDGAGLSEVTLYREIGIYAEIDGEEILYAYLNSDDKFDYIIPLGEGNRKEFTNNIIKITLVVGNSENVEVTLNNTIIPDESISMEMLSVEIKNYIEDIKVNCNENLNSHKEMSVLNNEGAHDFKYDKVENKFKYKEIDTWTDIYISKKIYPGGIILGSDTSSVGGANYTEKDVDIFVKHSQDTSLIINNIVRDGAHKMIFFRNGTYSFYSKLEFPQLKEIWLVGESSRLTTFFDRRKGEEEALVYYGDSWITIENISFSNNGNHSKNSNCILIGRNSYEGKRDQYIKYCDFRGFNYPIKMITNYANGIKGSKIICNNNFTGTIWLEDVYGFIVKDNIFTYDQSQSSVSKSGILLSNNIEKSIIINNYFDINCSITENSVQGSNNLIANNLFCS